MEWVLHPVVMTGNGKMGIMATGDGVYMVREMENKKFDLIYRLLLSQCERASTYKKETPRTLLF